MAADLTNLEQRARELRNAGLYREAAELFSAIVKENPGYEHGQSFYDLAGCYEDLGDFERAEVNYRRAIDHGPGNPYFGGGYASFLYRHGDPHAAFEAHLKLLKIESAHLAQPNAEVIDNIMTALRTLADKLGMTSAELTARLESVGSGAPKDAK